MPFPPNPPACFHRINVFANSILIVCCLTMAVPDTNSNPPSLKAGDKAKSQEQVSLEAASKMEEGKAPKNRKQKSDDYPTPQYVFNIFSPKEIVTTDSNIAQQDLIKSRCSNITQQDLIKSRWKTFTSDAAASTNNDDSKRVRVKLASLIVKMLNRLIKERILPKEAIFILIGQSNILVQILTSSSALPLLMNRCERIGVGNV